MKTKIYNIIGMSLILSLFLTVLFSCSRGEDAIPVLDPTPTYNNDSGVDFTDEELKLPRKKGVCMTLRNNGANMPKVIALNPGWNYSWGRELQKNQPEDIEFVPMQWGKKVDKEKFLSEVLPYVESGKFKRFLGFNEPDGKKQANMTVEEALEIWPILESLEIPLGSPATVNAQNGKWLEDFMSEADRLGYRVDYICVHNYTGTHVANFKSKMTAIYQKYKRPLLITEFAPADWNATTVEDNRHSKKDVLNFMKGVLPWMEETDFIYGYCWYSFSTTEPNGCTSALFDLDGNLTELGKYYASYDPNNPDPTPDPDPDPDPDPTPDPDPDPEESPNLIINGDFESTELDDISTRGWKAIHRKNNINYDNKTVNPNTTEYIIDGNGTLRFAGKKAWAGNSQIVKVQPGTCYEVGYIGRIQDAVGGPGGSSKNHVLSCVVRKPGDKQTIYVKLDDIEISENTSVKSEFTVPSGVEEVEILLSKNNGIAFMDNVYLRKKVESK